MVHLLGWRTAEGPRRRYAIHDGQRRQILLVRDVERPVEVTGRRGRELWTRRRGRPAAAS